MLHPGKPDSTSNLQDLKTPGIGLVDLTRLGVIASWRLSKVASLPTGCGFAALYFVARIFLCYLCEVLDLAKGMAPDDVMQERGKEAPEEPPERLRDRCLPPSNLRVT